MNELSGIPIGWLPLYVPPSSGPMAISVTAQIELELYALRWFNGVPGLVLVDLKIGAMSLIGSSYAAIGLHGDGFWEFPEQCVLCTQYVTATVENRSGAPGGVLLSVWGRMKHQPRLRGPR